MEHLRATASIGTFTLGCVSTAGRQLCRCLSEKFVVDVVILRVQVSVAEFVHKVKDDRFIRFCWDIFHQHFVNSKSAATSYSKKVCLNNQLLYPTLYDLAEISRIMLMSTANIHLNPIQAGLFRGCSRIRWGAGRGGKGPPP